MKTQHGFTLIELMIVVAIIAILAAIAMPAYQDYLARTQVTSGLSDIRGGETAFEELLNRGDTVNMPSIDASAIGLQTSTPRCAPLSVSSGYTTAAANTITCTLNGSQRIAGSTIELSRMNQTGLWKCLSTVLPKYLPNGCTAP